MNELQALVDALAATLGRPVGVDDRRFRVVAYSSHVDEVDPVRLASILQREAPQAVTTWLESLGIRDVHDHLRVPANPRFCMAARVCVPVRFDGTLLGYLWLIDEPEPLSEAELQISLGAARELGVALYRQRRLEHEDRQRERELLQQLVGRRPGDPAKAAAELLDGGFLATAAAYAVMAVEAFGADERETPDAVVVRLAAGVDRVRRGVAPRHLLMLVTGEQVIAVVATDAAEELAARSDALNRSLQTQLAQSPGWSAAIGVGDARRSLADLRHSADEAQQALRVARRIPSFRPLASWPRLGSYRALTRLTRDVDAGGVLPDPVVRLLDSPDAESLMATLEAYLDHAGDVRSAAAALFVHRSSVYGRLRRIEEVAGVDLRSGDARLELHMGVRLWRLAGAPKP